MEQLTRRALIDGTRLILAVLVIVASVAVVGWTIVRPYFGDFGGGLGTTECLESRPIPPRFDELPSVAAEHGWFPLGTTCRYSTATESVTQGPGWGATVTAGTATLIAAGAAAAFIRDVRSRARTP